MDFDLSDEQRQLGDNLARLMKERYGFDSRKAYGAAPLGFSEELWRRYAELGLLGAPFAEADGGFGGGAVETMLIGEAFGRALVLEPYLPTVVLGGGVLRHGASLAQREAMAITTDYLKTRKQFGVAIGSFQALQHRAAEMVVALEQARSMMMFATMMTGDSDAGERAKAISAAKVQIGRSAKFIGQQATQLHGGIAMTYEYKLGHLFKRLTMIDLAFGDADEHLKRLSDRDGLFG